MNMEKVCLNEKEAAHYIGMSRSFLRQDRMYSARQKSTPGLPYIKIGRTVRYMRKDLDQWLMCHRVE
ncbi:MAG: hypothetical protein K0R12_546 [Gammaproteobacteria bacterium]|nr:hypothetical protein [Gammaproteobacteria bacterium]